MRASAEQSIGMRPEALLRLARGLILRAAALRARNAFGDQDRANLLDQFATRYAAASKA